jgi:hypothetical protein
MGVTSRIAAHAPLATRNKASRLQPTSGIAAHRNDPRVIASREQMKRFALPAPMNLQKLVSDRSAR